MTLIDEINSCLKTITLASATAENRLACLQRLDTISQIHQATLPKDLLHYLQRRSYEKALLYMGTLREKS